MRFSASRIKTYMECPLQGHFKYDLKIPVTRNNAKAVFGRCIHAALEHYNLTANADGAERLFLDLWQNPEKAGAPVETLWWPRGNNYGNLRQRGIDVIRDFHQRCQWDGREVIATEHPFVVPFGEHELMGYVDLLEIRRSGKGKNLLRVVDYKTAAKQPNMGALILDIQFTIYVYASTCIEFWVGDGSSDFPGIPNGQWQFEVLDNLPRRAIWYHLWTAKEIDAGPRDESDFQRLYRVCQEIAKAKEAGIHVPKLGEACTLCDFRDPCAVTIPTKEELAEQENAWI